MDIRLKLNQEVTVGCQPSKQDLQELALEGYRSVVNLRPAGEEVEQLSPTSEGSLVYQLGMEYDHLPAALNSLNSATVDRFRADYAHLPKPVFVHCKSGKRAGAFALLHLAAERGWDGAKTLEEAEQMGLHLDQPQLLAFVESYADQHRTT